ncbi:P-II family nitrogen regulator [Treponema maltophilum]
MSRKSDHTLICVIVKSGYGEAVMQAARKAGAPGGTIIDARGTGTEQDMNFFGIQIVPEKEAVLIVAETKTADAITEAVKKLPHFGKPDSGILCTFAVESCFHLGTHN